MKKIALVQMTSTDSFEKNLDTALSLLIRAANNRADLIAFPENFLYLGSSKNYQEVASSIPGKITEIFQNQAAKHNISILLGSIIENTAQQPIRYYNTSVLIDRQGNLAARYRKIHLFDVDLPEIKLQESQYYLKGEEIVVCDHEIGKIGFSICYDIRFPMLFQKLADKGAEIVFAPAAFTLQTGKDHWLPLLQARAIENQIYLAAPAQFGRHNRLRISYGSTVIIDPWGIVTGRAPEKTGLLLGEIDLHYLHQIRKEMPVQSHRVEHIDY